MAIDVMRGSLSVLILAILALAGAGAVGLTPLPEPDIALEDPSGDVREADDLTAYVAGHEDIDITSASATLGARESLTFVMSVNGTVVDDEDIYYYFDLELEDEFVLEALYSDGTCTVYDSDYEMVPGAAATGAGTDTLTVVVPNSGVGDLSDYDLSAYTEEWDFTSDDDDLYIYFDDCPDGSSYWSDDYDDPYIWIDSPKDGQAVWGTVTIEGVAHLAGEAADSIEVRAGSGSAMGWTPVGPLDEGGNWSLPWDTTEVPDGKLELEARLVTENGTWTDGITVYVEQETGLDPPELDGLDITVGEAGVYDFAFGDEYDDLEDEDIELEVSATGAVTGSDNVRVNGTAYEAYSVVMDVSVRMQSGMESMSVSATSTSYLATDGLAIVKTEADVEMDSGFMGGTETSSMTSTFSPPLDAFDFPMTVGETWSATSFQTVEYDSSMEGEESSGEDSATVTYDFMCLREDEIEVPAGTFDSFVVWQAQTVEDEEYSMYGYILTYYSPEFSLPVKVEMYSPERDLMGSLELSKITDAASLVGEDGANSTGNGSGGDDGVLDAVFGGGTTTRLVVAVAAAAVACAVCAWAYVRRRRARLNKDGPDRPGKAYAPAIPSAVRPGTRPSAMRHGVAGARPHAAPGPGGPEVVSVRLVSRSAAPSFAPVGPPTTLVQCPGCSRMFRVAAGSPVIHCPGCGLSGSVAR